MKIKVKALIQVTDENGYTFTFNEKHIVKLELESH